MLRALRWPRMGVNPLRWNWITVKSVPFAIKEHINVLELKMFLFALRWRSRNFTNSSSRLLHLIDSQIALAVAVKGRSSSHQLNHVLRKCAALQVTADFYPLLAYVTSAQNPADHASRVFEPWLNRS